MLGGWINVCMFMGEAGGRREGADGIVKKEEKSAPSETSLIS